MITWVEIALDPLKWRYQALSDELTACGVENSVEYIKIETLDELSAAIEHAKKNFSQIRLGPKLSEKAAELYPDLPAELLSVNAIDAFVPEFGVWWARCFYAVGVTRSLVRDIKMLDLTQSVFIMGATWETRALVSTLARNGFNKILLSDVDEGVCQKMISELSRIHFGVQFQFVSKSMITQLPGTCSFGANLLSLVEHPSLVTELSYLNFLRPDGVWFESTVYDDESPLMIEAKSLGTQVETPIQVISNIDEAWAEHCFKIKIDLNRYRNSLLVSSKNPS